MTKLSVRFSAPKRLLALAGLTTLLLLLSFSAQAAGGEEVTLHEPVGGWAHHGMTGTFDKVQLQRGFQIYKEVCAACHSMKLLSYRHLQGIGFSEAEVKAIAAEYQVTDGPNDAGDMFQRPGLPSDRFVSPFANDNAARAANGGALPPDLSLMAKARHGNETYIYSLLTGYADAPAGVTIPQGMYYNKVFAGHQIAMPPPLGTEGQVTYADGTKASVAQMAADVSAFLMWAAEPKQDERKKIGLQVLLYLGLFAGIMYAAKKRLWSKLH